MTTTTTKIDNATARRFVRCWLAVQQHMRDAYRAAGEMEELALAGMFEGQPGAAQLVETCRNLRRNISQAGIETADDAALALLAAVLGPLVADDNEDA